MEIIQSIDDSLFDSSNLERFKKDIEDYYMCHGLKPEVEIISDKLVKISVDTGALDNIENMYNEASSYAQLQQYEKAETLFAEVVELAPLHSDAYRNLAQVQMMQGKLQEAIDNDLEALKTNPQNEWAWLLMGNIYLQKKDLKTAEKYFLRTLDVNQDNGVAINNLAGVYMEMEDYDSAIEYMKTALSIDSTYLNSYYGLALAYYKKGEKRKAFKVCVEGSLKSVDRNENPGAREELLRLMLTTANNIVDNESLMNVVELELDVIKDNCNVPIKMVIDEKQKVIAHLEYGAQHNRREHIICYKNGAFKEHAIMHEIMHLHFMNEDEKIGRLKVVGSREANYQLFKKRHLSLINKIAKKIGSVNADKFLGDIYDGAILFLMNTPLDLMVEDEIYKRKVMRPLQLLSLFNQTSQNVESSKTAAKDELIPQDILDVTKVLWIVNAMHLKKLYGLNLVHEFHPTKKILDLATDLFEEYEAYVDTYKTGDEYELMEYYVESLNFEDYMCIEEMQKRYSDGYELLEEIDEDKENPMDKMDFDIYTDEEKKREAEFQKTQAPENRDPMIDMMMSMYMLGALEFFDGMPMPTIKKIGFEIAMVGMSGIDPNKKSGYKVASIPDKDFGGYQFLAYYYVSWKIAIPEMADKMNLPYEGPYLTALEMFNKKKNQ